jgi:hypothetical protein
VSAPDRLPSAADANPIDPASGGEQSATVIFHARPADGTSNRSAAMWSPLAALRAAVDRTFPGVDAEVLEAIRMAASELGENVLKYGEPVDGVAGEVTVSRTTNGVEIRSVNRLTDPRRTERVVEILGRMVSGCDLRASFEARMLQIIEQPAQESTGLGLLRIAYEGLFELSYRHVDGTLTLVAARSHI